MDLMPVVCYMEQPDVGNRQDLVEHRFRIAKEDFPRDMGRKAGENCGTIVKTGKRILC